MLQGSSYWVSRTPGSDLCTERVASQSVNPLEVQSCEQYVVSDRHFQPECCDTAIGKPVHVHNERQDGPSDQAREVGREARGGCRFGANKRQSYDQAVLFRNDLAVCLQGSCTEITAGANDKSIYDRTFPSTGHSSLAVGMSAPGLADSFTRFCWLLSAPLHLSQRL